MAKATIPDALKADLPQTKWGKVLATTPVVMTVIATLLAGLSSGEMIRAQYDRSLAAQEQSKAGDQWGYFQAKRLRAALQRSTLDLLRGTASVHPLDAKTLVLSVTGTPGQAVLATSGGQQALDSLTHGSLPSAGPDPVLGAPITAVLAALDAGQSDAEITALLKSVKIADLASALSSAAAHVRAFDATLKPVTAAIDGLEKNLVHLPANVTDSAHPLPRDFIAARLGYAAQRYDAESRQNQVIAQLLELQVRQSNTSAERHHARSGFFFYGMLAAQLAVIISTLSMAVQKRNALWAIAAAAGVFAFAFAVYVYLFV